MEAPRKGHTNHRWSGTNAIATDRFLLSVGFDLVLHDHPVGFATLIPKRSKFERYPYCATGMVTRLCLQYWILIWQLFSRRVNWGGTRCELFRCWRVHHDFRLSAHVDEAGCRHDTDVSTQLHNAFSSLMPDWYGCDTFCEMRCPTHFSFVASNHCCHTFDTSVWS